ncbi:MAG: hypothetical protein KAW41_02185 [Candidatus Diapherotrites archaeon]|nr:hypothetical protein [Candidatus Diapherotrites archaeon]
MPKKPEKKHTWARTELSEDYFIPHGPLLPDVANAPRVTRVDEDGSKIHYRLKRSAESEEAALGEIAVGKELNSIGVIAPFPEKVEGPAGKGGKKGSLLLYPEIEGEVLADKLVEGVENNDLSFTELFSLIGEEDGRIVKHALKTGKSELLSFEHVDHHVLVTPEGGIARIDVAPFPKAMKRLANEKLTKETALLELLRPFFIGTSNSIAFQAEGPRSVKTRAIKGVIDNYFKGVEKVLGTGTAKSAKKKILKKLRSQGYADYLPD